MSDFEFTKESTATKRAKTATKEKVMVEQPPVAPSENADAEVEKETPKKEYDKEELLRIFDDVIFSGEYTEEVTIKNKLKVKFKTRTAEEISEISKTLDGTSFNLVATLQETRVILNLQYALVGYQGRDLAMEGVASRAKFINRLPGPVIGLLINALYEFDEKVSAACNEAEENF